MHLNARECNCLLFCCIYYIMALGFSVESSKLLQSDRSHNFTCKFYLCILDAHCSHFNSNCLLYFKFKHTPLTMTMELNCFNLSMSKIRYGSSTMMVENIVLQQNETNQFNKIIIIRQNLNSEQQNSLNFNRGWMQFARALTLSKFDEKGKLKSIRKVLFKSIRLWPMSLLLKKKIVVLSVLSSKLHSFEHTVSNIH